MSLKTFLKNKKLLTDELSNAIDEYYTELKSKRNNKNLTMPFGKYRGCNIDEVKKDTKYCNYLLTTSVFDEDRFRDVKENLYN